MKNSIFFFAFVFFSTASIAQERLEQLVKPGTKLMYRIDLKVKSYDMRVVVKSLNPFVFDYEIIDSLNARGTITHTKGGISNGVILHNNFTAGNKVLDEKTTSLWLSDRVYSNLSKHKRRPIKMFLNGLSGEQSNIGFAKGEKDFMVRVNGKQITIQQEYAKPKIKFNRNFETTGEEYFSYYNSAKLPLILKMRTNFYIELLDIINE
jgi:hypothetical protein